MSRNSTEAHHRKNADDGAGHSHSVEAGNELRVLWALVITGLYMIVEVIGGILSGSLALLADAGHMLTDTAALGLALTAFRVSRRPHDARRTYGYHRFQVIAAFINGVTMIAIVGWIAIEAIRRFMNPVEVVALPMLVVAGIGLIVNVVAFAILHSGSKQNLNLQGAALHVLGDLLGSMAAIVAALVILWSGWMPIDPLLSIVVAVLIFRSAWQLTRRSAHILLEGAPEWLNEAELQEELIAAVPAVRSIHHVHAWMLTQELPLLTLHAAISRDADSHQTLLAVNRFLKSRYGINHATVQLEPEGCVDAVPHKTSSATDCS